MVIKIFRWKFDDSIFEEFENYLLIKGKNIDSMDEGDIDEFLKGFNTNSNIVKEAFLNTMARRGLSKLISFGIEFDCQCNGCGGIVHSTQGIELEFDQESYLVCESCSQVVMKVKEYLNMGRTHKEASKIAEEISGGKTQIIFYEN
ncbi:MAG: hypothetical protein C4291_10000 [Candidatus Dadabacteria bacterium]